MKLPIYEMSTISTGRSSVDRDAGVIHGVKILGRESKNGRTYSENALNEAARQYEGCDVNVNHPDRSKPNVERRIEDGIGWLESVRVEKDGVYGDLHYLKEHPSSGLVAEAAERRSNRFGLSHNAQGTVKKLNGKNVVESIDRVLSVDLVQNPATNNGLFESTQRTIREALEHHAPELLTALLEDSGMLPPEVMDEPMAAGAAPEDNAAETVKSACAQILTAMLDLPGNVSAMCTQLIQVCQKVIAGQPEPKDPGADPNAEPKLDENGKPIEADPNDPSKPTDPATDPNAEQDPSAEADPANPFEKRKKPMAEATTPKSIEQRLALLEEENRLLKEKVGTSELREECEGLLRNHKREVTPARLTALANMPAEARLALIEEMPSIEEPEAPRARKPNFMSPAAHGSVGPYPSSVKELVESCR